LVEDVLALSDIPRDGRILEIGCGPGNATLPYAARGYHVTAIELGPQLAARAVQNLARFPRVRVVNASFEEWPLEENAFDLAISAEAMHWIPPEVGYPKVRLM
jgi:SAM-dependent methyltransferase